MRNWWSMKTLAPTLAIAALAASTLLAGAPAAAQTPWPSRPVTVVVSYPPGGISDLLARSVAQNMSKAWGQPVVVENRPGGNQIIAASYVAKAAPDGYTLLISDDGVFTLNPSLYTKLAYAPKDLAPIAGLADLKNLLAMSKAVPATDLQGMLAYAKSHPGQLNYATLGTGNIQHLLLESIKKEGKVDIVNIPYKGYPDAINDVLSNQAQLVSGGIGGPVLGHLQSGAIKALAVSGDKRSPLLPNVPTFAEAGLPNVKIRVQFVITGPAGMPADVLDKISRTATSIIRQDITDSVLIPNGMEPVGSNPATLQAFFATGRDYYAPMVKELGIRLD